MWGLEQTFPGLGQASTVWRRASMIWNRSFWIWGTASHDLGKMLDKWGNCSLGWWDLEHSLRTLCQPSGIWALASRICDKPPRSLVPGPWSRSLVPGPWSLVRGPWSLVPGPWSMVPGPWSLVPGPWSLAHGPWSLVPGPWSWIPGKALSLIHISEPTRPY